MTAWARVHECLQHVFSRMSARNMRVLPMSCVCYPGHDFKCDSIQVLLSGRWLLNPSHDFTTDCLHSPGPDLNVRAIEIMISSAFSIQVVT